MRCQRRSRLRGGPLRSQVGAHRSRPVARRCWRLVGRLGEQIISDLIRDSAVGTTQRTLTERYGISLSSAKRRTLSHVSGFAGPSSLPG